MISDAMMIKAMEAFWDAPGDDEARVRAALEAAFYEPARPQEAQDNICKSFQLMLNLVALRFKNHSDPKVAKTAKQCSDLVNRLTKFSWRNASDNA